VSHALEEAVGRIDDIPLTVGDWKGHRQEMPADEIAAARVNGYGAWHFENRRTGHSVTALVVCGRPGPVSVHTPDICYQGTGYEMSAGPSPLAISSSGKDGDANLQTATFTMEGPTGGGLRIFWGWNATGRWEAPGNPRWTFARSPALYKLYVVRAKRAKETVRAEEDPAVEFMKVFLPEVNRALFPRS
jgi:hypothetical protein